MRRILAEITYAAVFLAIILPVYYFGDWLAHLIVPH
jgi:hypothetical protein